MEKSNKKKAGTDGARVVDVHVKKKGFPAGIFLLLFFSLSLLSAAAVLAYFVLNGKKQINDIETYTRNYSSTLTEAVAGAAELSYKTKSYTNLKAVLDEKIQKNTYDEAFFVLRDGTLLAHSSVQIQKELGGNIANDALAYNTDLILKQAEDKSREILFTDYNIISKRIPFNRMERMLLKQYLYDRIDTSGWLVSKSVFAKGRPVGTVNLIISKNRIFQIIAMQLQESLQVLYVLAGISFLLSFAISLVVFVRYRSIQRQAVDQATRKMELVEHRTPEEVDVTHPQIFVEGDGDRAIPIELFEEERKGEVTGRVVELDSVRKDKKILEQQEITRGADTLFNAAKEVKDAIPIGKRSS